MSSDNLEWKEEIIKNKLGGKRDWSDQERIELCHQMDKEFDSEFKNIPKEVQKDRWTEDNWKEKMAEHPLFAGYVQDNSENAIAPENPLCDGIAQLKFDPEHNTSEELTHNYKEDGNIYFKAKKYHLAIRSYTEAIKHAVDDTQAINHAVDDTQAIKHAVDDDFLSKLYNNRSASHFSIGNYRSSLGDSEKAVSLNPSYAKSIERAAKCCLNLNHYVECINWCEKGANIKSIEKILMNVKCKAIKEKEKEDTRQRKNVIISRNNKAMLESFKEKKIPVYNSLSVCDTEELNSKLEDAHVRRNDAGDLEWDVAFIYPEYSESDLVERFNEHTKFSTQLKLMFDPPPPWDSENKYKAERLRLYFTDKSSGRPIPVHTESTLSVVLRNERYPIDSLFPSFLVLCENSKFKREFLGKFSR